MREQQVDLKGKNQEDQMNTDLLQIKKLEFKQVVNEEKIEEQMGSSQNVQTKGVTKLVQRSNQESLKLKNQLEKLDLLPRLQYFSITMEDGLQKKRKFRTVSQISKILTNSSNEYATNPGTQTSRNSPLSKTRTEKIRNLSFSKTYGLENNSFNRAESNEGRQFALRNSQIIKRKSRNFVLNDISPSQRRTDSGDSSNLGLKKGTSPYLFKEIGQKEAKIESAEHSISNSTSSIEKSQQTNLKSVLNYNKPACADQWKMRVASPNIPLSFYPNHYTKQIQQQFKIKNVKQYWTYRNVEKLEEQQRSNSNNDIKEDGVNKGGIVAAALNESSYSTLRSESSSDVLSDVDMMEKEVNNELFKKSDRRLIMPTTNNLFLFEPVDRKSIVVVNPDLVDKTVVEQNKKIKRRSPRSNLAQQIYGIKQKAAKFKDRNTNISDKDISQRLKMMNLKIEKDHSLFNQQFQSQLEKSPIIYIPRSQESIDNDDDAQHRERQGFNEKSALQPNQSNLQSYNVSPSRADHIIQFQPSSQKEMVIFQQDDYQSLKTIKKLDKLQNSNTLKVNEANEQKQDTSNIKDKSQIKESLSLKHKIQTQMFTEYDPLKQTFKNMSFLLKNQKNGQDLEKLKQQIFFCFLHTNAQIYSEINQGMMALISRDMELVEHLQHKFMMTAFEFHYFVMKFYDYTLAIEPERVEKYRSQLSSFKWDKRLKQKILHEILLILKRNKIQEENTNYLKESFEIKAIEYFPFSLMEKAGGTEKSENVVNDVFKLLGNEYFYFLDVKQNEVKLATQLYILLLHSNYEDFQSIYQKCIIKISIFYFYSFISKLPQKINILHIDFFVFKRSLWMALDKNNIQAETQYQIFEQIENIRYEIFQDKHFKVSSTVNLIRDQLMKNREFLNYFDLHTASDILNFVNNLMFVFQGYGDPLLFTEFLKTQLKFKISERFLFILQECIERYIPFDLDIPLQAAEIRIKFHRLQIYLGLEAEIFSCADNHTLILQKMQEKITLVCFENRLPYGLTDIQVYQQEFLMFFVSLCLNQYNIFTIYDCQSMTSLYRVTQNQYKFFILILKIVLQEILLQKYQQYILVDKIMKYLQLFNIFLL